MNLRDYQEHGINNIRARFVQGYNRVCFVAPCGAGKTLLMAYMANKAAELGHRTMFLVHRRELIEQAAETFQRLGLRYGVVAPGYEFNHAYIQIGSVQTVAKRIGRLPKQDLLILDECHHATANTWLEIIRFFHDARVVGLTATPARLNGQGLGEVFDTLVIGPKTKDLIRRGFLAPYKYYAPPMVANLENVKTSRGDFDSTDIAMRMDKPTITGDAIAHYKKLANNTQAIAYCAGRSHSINTAEMFKLAGISAVHVDSKTPLNERKQAMQDFKEKKIKILCNCDLFGEGVDVPAMETVILLRPTKSLTLYIQQSMRSMRPDKNNLDKKAIILDHVGNVMRHGLPDTQRDWTLEGKKKATRKNSESIVKIKVCSNCYSVHNPAEICPYCGFHYPIEERQIKQKSGELKEFTEEERKERRKETGRAFTLEDLQRIADERGYKAGWVYVQAKLKGIR